MAAPKPKANALDSLWQKLDTLKLVKPATQSKEASIDEKDLKQSKSPKAKKQGRPKTSK